jgi:hypothetical protein
MSESEKPPPTTAGTAKKTEENAGLGVVFLGLGVVLLVTMDTMAIGLPFLALGLYFLALSVIAGKKAKDALGSDGTAGGDPPAPS